MCGAIVKTENGIGAVVPSSCWETLSHISRFRQRPDSERGDVSQRRHWGRKEQPWRSRPVRGLMVFCSVVLSFTPEKLDIGLRSNEAGGQESSR